MATIINYWFNYFPYLHFYYSNFSPMLIIRVPQLYLNPYIFKKIVNNIIERCLNYKIVINKNVISLLGKIILLFSG